MFETIHTSSDIADFTITNDECIQEARLLVSSEGSEVIGDAGLQHHFSSVQGSNSTTFISWQKILGCLNISEAFVELKEYLSPARKLETLKNTELLFLDDEESILFCSL